MRRELHTGCDACFFWVPTAPLTTGRVCIRHGVRTPVQATACRVCACAVHPMCVPLPASYAKQGLLPLSTHKSCPHKVLLQGVAAPGARLVEHQLCHRDCPHNNATAPCSSCTGSRLEGWMPLRSCTQRETAAQHPPAQDQGPGQHWPQFLAATTTAPVCNAIACTLVRCLRCMRGSRPLTPPQRPPPARKPSHAAAQPSSRAT
jgi:hypothetical protein